MKAQQLETSDAHINLVEPDIERDAPLSQKWLDGEIGRNTLSLMGVSEDDNQASSLSLEKERIKDFIEKDDQLNWMIKLDDKVIGAIWVDLKPKDTVLAPSLHIMIGDPEARGRGVGYASTSAVIDYLKLQGYKQVYSRSLVNNNAATNLLRNNGFISGGEPYVDDNGLEWQNAVLNLL